MGIAALARCRHLLPQALKRNIYLAYVHSYLSYCLSLYGLNYLNKIMPLHVLQKRALRIVLDIGYRDSLKPHYTPLDVLPVPLLVRYNALVQIRLMLTGMHPNVLDLHGSAANTRGADNCRVIVKAAKSQSGKFTLGNLGVKSWNEVPPEIKSHPKIKVKLEQLLLKDTVQ